MLAPVDCGEPVVLHIGFTGTQRGMTTEQWSSMSQFFLQVDEPFNAYHGGCVGADEQFHKLVQQFINCEQVYIYPSNIKDKHGNCPLRPQDKRHHEYPPLSRNMLIIAASDVLLATPKESQMITRSGTWTTVRYAQKRGKQMRIFLPGGGFTTTP